MDNTPKPKLVGDTRPALRSADRVRGPVVHSLLQLPPVPTPISLSTRIVARVSTWTLAVLLITLVGGAIVACTVSVTLSIRATGVLEPAEVWLVHAREGGLIASIAVAPGDTVQAGQVLARLDTLELAELRSQLRGEVGSQLAVVSKMRAISPLEQQQRKHQDRQTAARLIQARAALRERLTNFGFGMNVDSVREHYAVGTHIEIDRALSELLIAETEHESALQLLGMPLNASLDEQREIVGLSKARERLAILQLREEHLVLSAPAAGVVTTLQTDRLVGTSVRPGDVILQVADVANWKARFYLSDRDVHDVAIGDSVRLEVPALRELAGQDLQGVVEFVAPAPQATEPGGSSNAARLFEVRARITGRPTGTVRADQLRTGFTANGRIVTRSGLIVSLAIDYLRDRFGSRE